MRTATPLTVESLTKVYGEVTALRDVSFTAQPGRVTGFLGPNGAGKTSTLRILLGLNRPTAGRALIDGQRYRELDAPLRRVGGSLSSDVFHPGRSGRDHLVTLALAAGIDRARVDTVLTQVGLADAGRRRVGGYSLGMRQRLGLAAALLGDPDALVLDEPINGLDPDGIRWMRGLLRHLADEGRTVLLSSHVLSEVQQTVDDVVVIRHGRIAFDGPLEALEAGSARVRVDAADRDALADALRRAGATVEPGPAGLSVLGLDVARTGEVALAAGLALTHLSDETDGLESVFLALTADEAEVTAAPADAPGVATSAEGSAA
ncbi:ATP-binding cassette domain-containing protein [Microcella frigidaquae]|uniref:ABC-2 type transport system ATP-binding protein n=1 Tax=Microcella frigidaquae TaxID=424758 RepID=A0A840X5C8_9MICO|nr:ATP-binding cassette domain-containing protein [Microcella frigidaquae]MBB5617431.1 ABC-2 type transport system ATP-binding protein [Microcella frigidaquae]NHN45608.1 ATP-binding cassette domain-containing protein [Microcella frigidaquae]